MAKLYDIVLVMRVSDDDPDARDNDKKKSFTRFRGLTYQQIVSFQETVANTLLGFGKALIGGAPGPTSNVRQDLVLIVRIFKEGQRGRDKVLSVNKQRYEDMRSDAVDGTIDGLSAAITAAGFTTPNPLR